MATAIIRAHAQAANAVPVLQHDGESVRCGTFTPEDDSAPVLLVGRAAPVEAIYRAAIRHGAGANLRVLPAQHQCGDS